MAASAFAGHNPAVVDIAGGACEETTFTASITDPDGGHKTANMRLVVHADGVTQVSDVIPTDGTDVSLTVGPFATNTTVQWRVFGGGERDYDSPHWNGYGDANFSADITAYGAEHGFGFVVAGPDDPNPFTTWHEVDVEGCSPETKDDCKNGGWATYGFRNQGQCIRFVNTGQDSR